MVKDWPTDFRIAVDICSAAHALFPWWFLTMYVYSAAHRVSRVKMLVKIPLTLPSHPGEKVLLSPSLDGRRQGGGDLDANRYGFHYKRRS